ncbi:branched-chain amino acid ABC transporter substrate-binding protein [Nakamurella antarctica]|uniref:Branched-chain amino acid ABC transporter substrate-binding protein n=1 Tax=Nakamurella antarctica TaxID=1902245 RepID=A0A3G8ZKQ2_9ACTN|nr:branched-chain amino acid ABC transporter substrate-binding protein [Nakamurella antarctica]AZI57892.1 branched-chain amino acid ABC transporter substrate-binding protein [Nakamurella antarctica]
MRSSSLAKFAAIAAVGALALAACSNSTSDAKSSSSAAPAASSSSSSAAPAASSDAATSETSSAAGGASNSDTVYKIGFQGPLSGDNQQLGINESNGVELAVEQANASGDLGFTLELVKSDDVGLPDKSPAAAATLIQDTGVVGVVGPAFSGSTKAVGATYSAANLALISPSATNATLTTSGFTAFHRIVPTDAVESAGTAKWLAKTVKSVFIVDDLSDYGKGAADELEKGLKSAGIKTQREGVDAKTTDYSAIAQKVATSGDEALFYGGYDAQVSLFARALKSAGYKGVTVTGNGGKSSVFTEGAGDAGDGWYFSCGCLDATTAPAAKDFEAAYVKKYNQPSSTYSPEAYDAANAMISVIKDLAAKGEVTREDVMAGVKALDYKGITTQVKFTESGEVEAATINLYRQEKGVINLLGDMKDQ